MNVGVILVQIWCKWVEKLVFCIQKSYKNQRASLFKTCLIFNDERDPDKGPDEMFRFVKVMKH